MDVDLLRPGTVPISPETVLWFEFLLDKDLLYKHLQKNNPDPTPSELINKFSVAIFECSKNEPKREFVENAEYIYSVEATLEQNFNSSKIKALKILVLKVAAYIKWSLDTIRSLPFKVQLGLLQNLLFFTNNNTAVEIPNIPEITNPAGLPEPYLFALILYHRWLIVSCVRLPNSYGQNRMPMINNDFMVVDETDIFSEENLRKSLNFLSNVLTWIKIPDLLTFDCFVVLTESNSNVEFDWLKAAPVKNEEYFAQIHYELAMYYFYKENYELASSHFVQSMDCFKISREPTGLMNFNINTLESYMLACNLQTNNAETTLLHQLRMSVASQFTNLLNILLRDNVQRQIPVIHRRNIELDIVAAISSGKFTVARDLLPKVQTLNLLRCLLEDKAIKYFQYRLNSDAFIWALLSLWQHWPPKDKGIVIKFIGKLILKNKSENLLDKLSEHKIFREEIVDNIYIRELLEDLDKPVEIPSLLDNIPWDLYDYSKKRNAKLEIRTLEQLIILSYNPEEIRELLGKLSNIELGRSLWKINAHWTLPIPLQSVLMCCPKGFLQDFAYILLAKARELSLIKDWNGAIQLLSLLEKETQFGVNNPISKLNKLIGWEILLIKINELLEEWPSLNSDRQALIVACEQCLKSNDVVLPRTEVMEQSMICLLNLNYWDIVNSIEKRWNNFEIALAIILACQELMKGKGSKKYAKELWDVVLPVFTCNPSKRSNMGGGGSVHRDSPINNDRIIMLSHFTKLRDSVSLAVIISLLTRLYNILKDESTLELNVDNLMMWPPVVTNSSSYNISAVLELLSQLVDQGLLYYPTNCSWLRLAGDINFVNYNFKKSMSFYLKYLLLSTDYFHIISKTEESLFKRMIKCCLALNCHTQVAVLTQFFDEPDYLLAFRSLSDPKCNDAIDAYYHCFWDTNILEYLVHIHHKKTEFQRRKRAIQSMALLELNANNNEEIQREASMLRKKAFLRALCKQYIPI